MQTKTLDTVCYITLPNGYSRKAKPEVMTFHIITLDEVKAWASPKPEACTCVNGRQTLTFHDDEHVKRYNEFRQTSHQKGETITYDCVACNGTGTRQVYTTPSHVWYHMPDGKARQVKVNSRVKLWKRDPNRVEVSIKYGLYEHARLTADDINNGVLLLPVDNA